MKHFIILILVLVSFSLPAQKKQPDKPKDPTPQKDTAHLPLEQWAVNDMVNYETEIAKVEKQITESQTYLQVIQIRKADLMTTLIKTDKRKNKTDINQVSGANRIGNVLVLQLKKPDTTKVKADTLKTGK